MCNFSEGFFDRGYDRGYNSSFNVTTLQHIQDVMSALNYSAEQAMDLFKIDEDKRDFFRSQL